MLTERQASAPTLPPETGPQALPARLAFLRQHPELPRSAGRSQPGAGPAAPPCVRRLLFQALGRSQLRIMSCWRHLFLAASLTSSQAEREDVSSRGPGALPHC